MEIEIEASREEAVELVTPPSTNILQLLRFVVQLQEVLRDNDSRGSTLSAVRSWECGTVITVMLEPDQVSNLVIKLALMADVKKVQEDTLATGDLSRFADRLRVPLMLSINPSKRLYLTLEEIDVAR